MHSVLVVCVGNLCRSPMAEGLLRRALVAAPALSVTVESAGTHAPGGLPADEHAVEVMHRHGMDIDAHRSRLLTASLCAQFDLILTMDRPQRSEIIRRFPNAGGKVFTLDDQPVPDPFGRPEHVFVECFHQMAQAVDRWQSRIRMLAKPNRGIQR